MLLKIIKFITLLVISVFVIIAGTCVYNLYNVFYVDDKPIIKYGKNCSYRLKYISKIPFYDGILGTLKDGRILIKTFYSSRDVEIFDPETNKFRKLKNKTNVYHENHHSIVLNDGRLLIVDNTGIEVFDPKTEKFTLLNKMITPRIDEAVVYIPPDKVYIIGGKKSLRDKDVPIWFKDFYNDEKLLDNSNLYFTMSPQIEIYDIKKNNIYTSAAEAMLSIFDLNNPSAFIVNNDEILIEAYDSYLYKSCFYLYNYQTNKVKEFKKDEAPKLRSIKDENTSYHYNDAIPLSFDLTNEEHLKIASDQDGFKNQIIDKNDKKNKPSTIFTSFEIINFVRLKSPSKYLLFVRKKQQKPLFEPILRLTELLNMITLSEYNAYTNLLNANIISVYRLERIKK